MIKREKLEQEKDGELVVGLDIGTTKIVAVVGQMGSDGKIEILGHGRAPSTGIEFGGSIVNLDQTTKGINTAIETAEERSEVEINSVYAGIAALHIKTYLYKHAFIRPNGMNETIKQEEIDTITNSIKDMEVDKGEKVICVIPQKFIIGKTRESLNPVGEVGTEVEGLFQTITGNINEISKVIKCIKDAQLQPNEIILEPLASGLACISEEQKKDGAIVIDMGGGTTDIAIYIQGKPVFTKVVPLGGEIITKDISEICSISMEMAGQLKMKYGTCVVNKADVNNNIVLSQNNQLGNSEIQEATLAQIIFKRVDQIFTFVQEAIISSGYADKVKIGSGIFLTGGGAKLKDIKELCAFKLCIPTRIAIPNAGFSPSIPEEVKDPIYSTSLGLLKFGIAESMKKERAEKSNETKGSKGEKYDNDKENKGGGKIGGIFDSLSSFLNNAINSVAEKTS